MQVTETPTTSVHRANRIFADHRVCQLEIERLTRKEALEEALDLVEEFLSPTDDSALLVAEGLCDLAKVWNFQLPLRPDWIAGFES